MKGAATSLVLLCVLLGSLLAGAGSARAATGPSVALPDVLSALGVGEPAGDYAVLLDTSSSMATGGRWAMAVAGLRTFLTGLSPADTVTLITFDETPTVRADRVTPEQVRAAVAELPDRPGGASTDIGAAIAAGLLSLEAAPPGRAGGVVILSDGVSSPVGGPYAHLDGPGWQALAQSGGRLADHVRGYAFSLGTGESGAALLGRALPGTAVLRLSGAELMRYLAELPARLQRDAAGARVDPDLAVAVDARWVLPAGSPDLGEPVTVTVVVHSPCRVLPLVLDDLAVTVAGTPLTVTGLPDHLDMAPGAEVSVPLQVRARDAGADWWRPGRRATAAAADLRLTARVDTPWRTVLENDLRQTPHLAPLGTAARLTGIVPGGLSWALVGGLVAMLLLVVLGALLLRVRGHPRLHGSILLTDVDGWSWTYPLSGRSATFPRPGEVAGRYRVRGTRDGGVLVGYRADGRPPTAPRSCPPGEPVDIGGVLVCYTPEQRRR